MTLSVDVHSLQDSYCTKIILTYLFYMHIIPCYTYVPLYSSFHVNTGDIFIGCNDLL